MSLAGRAAGGGKRGTVSDAATAAEGESGAGPLGYAPPPPLHRRRSVRVAATAVPLALFVVSSLWWGPPVVARWSLLSHQRQCLRYEPPDGAVVFSQGAAETLESKPWDKPAAYSIPKVWSTFQPRLGADGRQSHGVVFLHERTSPGGNRRLVVLDLSVGWFKNNTELSLDKGVASVATWNSDPRWVPPVSGDSDSSVTDGNAVRQSILSVPYGHSIAILPGRPDPKDRSRFTIGFRAGEQSGVIDGRLEDDDTVTLRVRGAADRRHPSLPVRITAPAPATPPHDSGAN